MKSIRFLADFFSVDGSGNSFVKYAKGGIYPSDDETLGQVAAGFAEEVDTPKASAVKNQSAPTTAQETKPVAANADEA